MQHATDTREHRALGVSALGVLLAVIGGFAAYQGYLMQSTQVSAAPAAYKYSIRQAASTDISYMDSSFFGKAPAPDNQAYISDLTKDIAATFHYEFAGSTPTQLTTTYSAKAEVQANYALKGNSDNNANVWRQSYQLIAPTVVQTNSTGVTLDKTITIPFADYKAAANQFRTTLQLPTSSDAVATFTVHTTGVVDGTPFDDTRTSTVSMPLEQQIYQPAVKFDKEDTKQVVAQNAQQGHARLTKAELYGGVAVALAGLGLVGYGMRKRIFKSAYQRELDKIYRYHDGIIVRTSRPIDLADHHVVPMRSFDDMLNLEEELKTPIIADEISSTLTHFLIANNSVTYLYKLGDGDDNTNQVIATRATSQALAAAHQPHIAREVLRPTAPVLAAAANTNDDFSDIINELEHPASEARPHSPHAPHAHKKRIQ